jgi:hypothetical protein
MYLLILTLVFASGAWLMLREDHARKAAGRCALIAPVVVLGSTPFYDGVVGLLT